MSDTTHLASSVTAPSGNPSTFSSSPTVTDPVVDGTNYATSKIEPAAVPEIIPLAHTARTLVLCFDGTGDQFDDDNSNIVRFFSMLKRNDRSQQMVYYQAGIGTYTSPIIATPLAAKMSKAVDAAIAWNIKAHVLGGYEFLMQNYEAGDKICIFGFSRGAHTAQGLAAMLSAVGLLPACNHQQIPFAYKMYLESANPDQWKQVHIFRDTFSVEVPIEFVGLWDTVSSVGLSGRSLPFTGQNRFVKTLRHAISADEHRVRFRPNYYRGPKDSRFPTDVLEVWFAGCHCDVGGGSVRNDVEHNLARIPLRWMIRQCFLAETGILFNSAGLRKVGLDPAALYPKVLERPPALQIPPSIVEKDTPLTEEEHDVLDALSPMYDQLRNKPIWWLLEIIPARRWVRTEKNTWLKEITLMNLGEGRKVYRQRTDGLHLHRTIKIRMEAEGLPEGRYKPRAKFEVEPRWMD